MDDVKGFVKQYWPYILGGIVGLYLILRYMGGSSGGASSGGSDYAAFLQAQTNAASQNAQLQAQLSAQQTQAQLQRDSLAAQVAHDNAVLDVQRLAVQSEALSSFTTAQAAMAGAIGTSTANVINALNNPALMAMQANAAENASALDAAATIAAASFLTQGQMVASGSNMVGDLSRVITPIQIPQQSQQPGKIGQAVNIAGRAVAAYYTAGASEAAGAFSNSGSGSGYSGYGSGYGLDYGQRAT